MAAKKDGPPAPTPPAPPTPPTSPPTSPPPDPTEGEGEQKDEAAEHRTLSVCLVREVSTDTIKDAIAAGVEMPLLEILADETDGIRDDKGVEQWMADKDFEGELYVLVFRKGAGKRVGTNGRLRRRRFKPADYVVE